MPSGRFDRGARSVAVLHGFLREIDSVLLLANHRQASQLLQHAYTPFLGTIVKDLFRCAIPIFQQRTSFLVDSWVGAPSLQLARPMTWLYRMQCVIRSVVCVTRMETVRRLRGLSYQCGGHPDRSDCQHGAHSLTVRLFSDICQCSANSVRSSCSTTVSLPYHDR